MAKGMVFSYIAAYLHGVDDFIVGAHRVKSLQVGPGQPGYLLVIISFDPCEDNPNAPTERRFMVSPVSCTFEVGEPTEVDMPDEPTAPPQLVVPTTRLERR
jgi:hypothetical protein